ncbi:MULTISPECIES: type I-F CRISPR-associated protein Csy3 [Cysteiniphilum]|uniref:type I-F CRISPR-associated protein Csy3 n=1 Tax=Cysteiniphilum TaxID=2056696 RepID=UPI00177DE9E6|nr:MULTISPECIES: type I-F CRISPR-associated protein Csy3 [Cysteiniphilum]
MAKEKDVVSVLAFEKKLVPSDGYLYGATWSNKQSTAEPLKLKEKSVRGTISNRLKPAIQKDPAKLNSEVEKPNLQTVDACALAPYHDTLKIHFTLKVLGGLHQPSACNNANFKQTYEQAIRSYIEREGCNEVAKRYVLNIANGRFLWRNRFGAESIEVQVKALTKEGQRNWCFDAHKYNIRDMSYSDTGINELATEIACALASEGDFLMLEIDCYAKVGKSQDVYPSEELVLDKGKGAKSKVLYAVSDVAAMHSQKIGNALRTIDTWYSDFNDPLTSAGPIAIEPYGAVTNLGKAFRTPKDKQDFYTFFDSWARGAKLKSEDEHYVVAMLIRGGVFGESDK